MPAQNFDITASFRPEPQTAGNSNAPRNDRAADNAFADILRAQNNERDALPAETREDSAPRDDAPTSSYEKTPRQTKDKDNEPAAKPAPRESAKTETPETVAEIPSGEGQAQPKAKKDSSNDGEKVAAPTVETTPDVVAEPALQDVAALQVAAAVVAVAAPVVPVAPQTSDINVGAAANGAAKTAPVTPTPNTAPLPDASQLAGATAPTADAADTPAPAAPATPVAATDAATATPEFDQLVAAALRGVKPKETHNAPAADAATPATPVKPAAQAAVIKASATPAPAATTNLAIPADAATATVTPAPVAAVAPAVTTTTPAVDDENVNATVAAVVTRPAMPRQAETRTNAPAPTDVNLLPEPEMPELDAAPAPAPRSGQGMLTAATGLAAQVKAQELQNAPQPGAEKQATLSTDKLPVESAAAKAATPDVAAKTDHETPATTAARAADAQTPAPTHDGNVRGTSFADSLSAARGARATANPLVAQVAVHVAKAVSEGNDRITIKLSPADLGRIDVRLDIGTDGRIQAVFAADKPGTVEMLQRDARELERSLQDAGLRADSGSLSFNLRGEQQQDKNSPGFAGGASAANGGEALPDVPAAVTQVYSNTAAGNGRLDIHV
jgi:flagellar hook-length control protein FliK